MAKDERGKRRTFVTKRHNGRLLLFRTLLLVPSGSFATSWIESQGNRSVFDNIPMFSVLNGVDTTHAVSFRSYD